MADLGTRHPHDHLSVGSQGVLNGLSTSDGYELSPPPQVEGARRTYIFGDSATILKGGNSWVYAGKVFEDEVWWYSKKVLGGSDGDVPPPPLIVDCTEHGARLPNVLDRLRREMKELAEEENDPDLIRAGLRLKVPPIALCCSSGRGTRFGRRVKTPTPTNPGNRRAAWTVWDSRCTCSMLGVGHCSTFATIAGCSACRPDSLGISVKPG